MVAAILLTAFLLLRITHPSGGDYLSRIPSEYLQAQPLTTRLSYVFPYDSEAEFPKTIWQTWKYSPSQDEFDSSLRLAEASWSKLNPGYEHRVVTDSDAASLVRWLYARIPEIHRAFEALPEPVLKADFFRYLILLAQGGIYSDIDTTALKPVADWLPAEGPSSYGLVVGIEADSDRVDWADFYARRIQFCQWTIQSKPGHPVLVDIVASITEETLQLRELGELNKQKMKSVMDFTGPGIWTDTIFRYFNDAAYFDMSKTRNTTWRQFANLTRAVKMGDVVVLPITSFSPGVGHMGAGSVSHPMAFVRHAFKGGHDCHTFKKSALTED